jgi:hypothetical protein
VRGDTPRDLPMRPLTFRVDVEYGRLCVTARIGGATYCTSSSKRVGPCDWVGELRLVVEPITSEERST